ncbi:MAG: hypothetical protein ACYTGN_13830 [Planctomycetota bacterium]|jgi:hypothetical protein
MRRFALLALLVLTLPSCAYLRDRGIDFVDQFRGAVGAGSTIGIRGRAWGVLDTGLMVGIRPRAAALGLNYGTPLFFNTRDIRADADQAELVKASSSKGMDFGTGDYDAGRMSIFFMPALLTWADSTPRDMEWTVPEEGDEFKDHHWIWSAETFRHNRYTQIHAFDVEFAIGLGIYLDLGYSPGETLDFLLGIFGIDIAKDDGRLG